MRLNFLEEIELIEGINTNIVPLDFSNKMTTIEILHEMESKINKLIKDCNNNSSDLSSALKESLNKLEEKVKEFTNECDYNVENYLKTITNHLDYAIQDRISEQVKLFQVGIDKDGHFYITCPTSWKEIEFDTNENNELILKYPND